MNVSLPDSSGRSRLYSEVLEISPDLGAEAALALHHEAARSAARLRRAGREIRSRYLAGVDASRRLEASSTQT